MEDQAESHDPRSDFWSHFSEFEPDFESLSVAECGYFHKFDDLTEEQQKLIYKKSVEDMAWAKRNRIVGDRFMKKFFSEMHSTKTGYQVEN